MRKLSFLALIPPLTAGCGGGGGSSTPSPFAGNYTGTWSSAAPSDTSTDTATIATNGTVTGTIHDNGANADGSFTGTISNSGAVSVTVSYPGSASYQATGTLAFNQSGQLTGTVQETISGNTYSDSFTFTKS